MKQVLLYGFCVLLSGVLFYMVCEVGFPPGLSAVFATAFLVMTIAAFRPWLYRKKTLQRGRDFELNEATGTLTLKRPIPKGSVVAVSYTYEGKP